MCQYFIPFYGWIIFHCIYQIWFIHSFVDRHLDCFHHLAIVNSAAKNMCTGLPWWRGGWESTCQCRGHGFEPWSGKIPPAAERLSLCTTTTEPAFWSPWATTTEPVSHNYWVPVPQLLKPVFLEPMLRNKRDTAMRDLCTSTKSSPCSPQLERACAQQWRPNTAKNK